MQPRHLELLRQLSVHGSLAAVAAATHRTPSALSQQLKTASADLGVRLVEPDSRGIRLTPEGQLLAEGADEVLAAIEGLRARLEAAAGEPRGIVRLAVLPSAATVLLPALMGRLAGSGIRLEVDDLDVAESDFAARTLTADVVIAHSPAGGAPRGSEGLRRRTLLREPLDIAVPPGHPLAALPSLDPADLAGTRWIGVPPGYPFDAVLVAVEQQLGTPLERVLRVRDNQLVRSLVGAGVGLAVLPRLTTAPGPDIALRPLRHPAAQRSVVALARRDIAQRSAVAEVLRLLTEIGRAAGESAPRI